MKNPLRFIFYLLLLGLLSFPGCSFPTLESEDHTTLTLVPSQPPASGTVSLQTHSPGLVAILPFLNLTSNTDKEEESEELEIIRTAFQNHFSSRGYNTQWVKSTDKLLRERGLQEPTDINRTPIETLAQITKADALFYGELTHFDRLFLGLYSQVAVGVRLKMVDAKSNKVLWQGEDVSRGHSGGFSIDPIGIAITLATSAMALRKIELVREADDLFRDMVKTIPYSHMSQGGERPTITLLVNEAATRSIKAGEEIVVGMTGDPELAAFFDVGDFRLGIPMEETQPGVYIGSYRVKPGENATALTVRANLKNPNGLTTKWVDALGSVEIDTTPPATPTGISTTGRDHVVTVQWEPGPESDLARYRVYRSHQESGEFTFRAITDSPRFSDQDLRNHHTYFYKVTAIDLAGNESSRSGKIAGTPVRTGPTMIWDHIARDTRWFAEASPYIVGRDITVARGATLTLEPGTEVRVQLGGLRIRGRLVAKGTPEQMITFRANSSDPTARWTGLIFEHTGEKPSDLRHVRVSQATAGVMCLGSSPKLAHLEISGNDTGLLLRDSSAHPLVESSLITRNTGDGIQIHNGAHPRVVGSRIVYNGHHGITVANTPELTIQGNELFGNQVLDLAGDTAHGAIDATGNWWGTTHGGKILSKIQGRVTMRNFLSSAQKNAETIPFPALGPQLPGTLTTSAFLTLEHSPYVIIQPLVIQNGATLGIQAGVTITFHRKMASIIIQDGTLRALGTPRHPILFTSAMTSPQSGDFLVAVKFEGEGPEPSVLTYVGVLYAETAFLVKAGSPEFDHTYIGQTLKSGLVGLGTSVPRVSFSTIEHQSSHPALRFSDESRPILFHNNVLTTSLAIKNESSHPLDIRQNWWGDPTPNPELFSGKVEFVPCLAAPEPEAFVLAGRGRTQVPRRRGEYEKPWGGVSFSKGQK